MVKQVLLNTIAQFDLTYTLVHPDFPCPKIGFRPDWESMHAGIPNLLLDHSACPGIQARERIGITLFMPYTCRFFRDGRVEVDTYWEEGGSGKFTFIPTQEMVQIRPTGERFPGYIAELPQSSSLKFPLHMFVLGDLRVGAWIIQAGVFMTGLPENYTLLMLPLPNYRYPPGFSVGQAMALSLSNISGQMKIPVDIDFSAISAEQDAIVIPRGQPMVHYIPVKLPEIRLVRDDSILDSGGKA
ncbi:hypothetical protein FBR05_14605 [Deltaproteobacteria bacterium PRO3]|nr:hypothetical protein [Deltaproteobacteria bacterium PRO3]